MYVTRYIEECTLRRVKGHMGGKKGTVSGGMCAVQLHSFQIEH